MWKIDTADDAAEGLVQFFDSGDSAAAWSIDVRGGEFGIRIRAGKFDRVDDIDKANSISFDPVGEDTLPVLAEQFVRGDELHLWYPQQAGSYGLRLMFQPVAVSAKISVLEATLSIQTDLLDSRPMIDVVASCESVRSVTPSDGDLPNQQSMGTAPMVIAERRSESIVVLLGPHDRPFTTNESRDTELRLRLFGDFLEKGVIRKARPWLVMYAGDDEIDESYLQQSWRQLCESPLPLTP